METMDLQPFKSMLRENCGLWFEAEKETLLCDGIRARMSERGMSTDSEYLACLRRNDDELSHLINLVTINETYFFREPVHLDLLADTCFPEIKAARPPGSPVRILCAGCSTGEEAYSVMIRLLEKYGAGIGNLVSVIGVDIDSDALSQGGRRRSTAIFPSGASRKRFGKNIFCLRERPLCGQGFCEGPCPLS